MRIHRSEPVNSHNHLADRVHFILTFQKRIHLHGTNVRMRHRFYSRTNLYATLTIHQC